MQSVKQNHKKSYQSFAVLQFAGVEVCTQLQNEQFTYTSYFHLSFPVAGFVPSSLNVAVQVSIRSTFTIKKHTLCQG